MRTYLAGVCEGVCVRACLSVRLNVTVCQCMRKPRKAQCLFSLAAAFCFCRVTELVCTSVCVQVCLHGRPSAGLPLISVCCQRPSAINGTPPPPPPPLPSLLQLVSQNVFCVQQTKDIKKTERINESEK